MEVDAKVLAAMRDGAEALHGALSVLGKKMDAGFRPATLHKREQVVEGIGGAFEACTLTMDELSKTADELIAKLAETTKDVSDASAIAETALTQLDKLAKGYKACPDCGMSGKLAKGDSCPKCEGQGFVKTK